MSHKDVNKPKDIVRKSQWPHATAVFGQSLIQHCAACPQRQRPWKGDLADCPCTADSQPLSRHAEARDCPHRRYPHQMLADEITRRRQEEKAAAARALAARAIRAADRIAAIKTKTAEIATNPQIQSRRAACESCPHHGGLEASILTHCKKLSEKECRNTIRLDTGACPGGVWAQAEKQRRVILKHFLSVGDVVVMTAAVRDLKKTYGQSLLIDVRTPFAAIWENNPHLTPLQDGADGVETIDVGYPSINRSNQSGEHFIQAFAADIAQKLGMPFRVSELKGDLHLSGEETGWTNQVEQTFGLKEPFWVMMVPGGKWDFTAKWWNPDHARRLVEYFRGRVAFVRCGSSDHYHPEIPGALDLIGKTDLRQFIRLIYNAQGVICPVTAAMHIAAALPEKAGQPRHCIVIAGGREPVAWERYPGHQFLHTEGQMDCCRRGGCWKSRCQRVGDGDPKDKDVCPHAVETGAIFTGKDGRTVRLVVPRCMDDVTAGYVTRIVAQTMESES